MMPKSSPKRRLADSGTSDHTVPMMKHFVASGCGQWSVGGLSTSSVVQTEPARLGFLLDNISLLRAAQPSAMLCMAIMTIDHAA